MSDSLSMDGMTLAEFDLKSVPHGWFEVEDEPNLDSLLLGADVDFELSRDSSNAMDYSPTSDFWSEM